MLRFGWDSEWRGAEAGTAVALAAGWLVLARADGFIRAWRPAPFRPVAATPVTPDWLRALAVAPDGRTVAVGDEEGQVHLLQTEAGRRQTWPAHRGPVVGLGFLTGRRLASVGDDRMLRIWEWPAGTLRGESVLPHRPHVLAVMPGGRLGVGLHDGRVWMAGKAVVCSREAILSLAPSPDGRRLAAGDGGGEVHLLRLPGGVPDGRLRALSGPVLALAFSADGRHLMVGGRAEAPLQVWDLAAGRPVEGGLPDVREAVLALAADGRRWALGGWDCFLYVGAEGRGTAVGGAHAGGVRALAFLPDGRLVSAGEDGFIRIWPRAPEESVGFPSGHEGRVCGLALAPEGPFLASADLRGRIRLWRFPPGEFITELRGHRDTVRALGFSPDGRLLASGDDAGDIRLWRVPEGEEVANLEAHGDWIRVVAFSPDGTLLASGADDCKVCLWSLPQGCLVGTFREDGWVYALAFSPDGRRLAVGTKAGTVRIYDLSGRSTEAVFDVGAEVHALAFSPDGRRLAVGGADGKQGIWTPPGSWQVPEGPLPNAEAVGAVVWTPEGVALGTQGGRVAFWQAAPEVPTAG